jgi:hypothetical protein
MSWRTIVCVKGPQRMQLLGGVGGQAEAPQRRSGFVVSAIASAAFEGGPPGALLAGRASCCPTASWLATIERPSLESGSWKERGTYHRHRAACLGN